VSGTRLLYILRRWTKKIRGKLFSFGLWSDGQAARKKYQEQKANRFAGRTPACLQTALPFATCSTVS
jgi:hypothetical protein